MVNLLVHIVFYTEHWFIEIGRIFTALWWLKSFFSRSDKLVPPAEIWPVSHTLNKNIYLKFNIQCV